jgi:hypothetical protein
MFLLRAYRVSSHSGRLRSCSEFSKRRLSQIPVSSKRAVIEFLVHENESVVNIHKRLCAVYGSCAVDRGTVGRWAKRVKASGSAETELRDLPRSGHPATANTPDMLNSADAIILADRRITTRQLVLQLSIALEVCVQLLRNVAPA